MERPCLICGREADEERGWVKETADSDRVFWLCNECLEARDFRIEWLGGQPAPVRVPVGRDEVWAAHREGRAVI